MVMKLQKTVAALFGTLLASSGVMAIAQQPPLSGTNPAFVENEGRIRPVLRTMPLPKERLKDVADALGLKYAGDPSIKISADQGRGELVIMAPQNFHAQIDGEIRTMLASGVAQRRGRTVSTATISKQFPLNRISWREFEDGLQALAGGRLQSTTRRNGELASFELVDQPLGRATLEVDRRSNAVTVVAPEPTVDGWQTIIESLDLDRTNAGEVLQLARIQNAEPAPIQEAIRLLRQLKMSSAPGDGSTVGVAGGNVRFMGTGFSPQDGAPAAAPPGAAQAPVGDAGAGDGAAGEEGGLFGDVQIQFVPELGVIVVRGAKRDVERVMKVIDEIEAAAVTTQPQIAVHSLEHVDSEAVAELVRQLYTDVLNTRGAGLSITGLVKPNALLLIGRQEAIDSALVLIKQLDVPVDASTQLKVFRLLHASAVDAETTVRNFFSARPGIEDEELRPILGTRVRVIADYRTNSLVVQAAPRDLAEVAKLIRDLDVNQVPAQNEIRVFPLKNALAEDLTPILQEAVTGQSDAQLPDNFTRPSTTLSILAVDSDGSRVIDSGLLAGVVVTADANANALVVRAPNSSMPLIAELIRQLDQLPGAESVVKVFQLENSDASALSTALTSLFASQQQQGGAGGGGGGFPLNLAQSTASGESSLVPLRFSTDSRTNSVIAVGTVSDLEVVESIVLRLDTEGFSSRITEVIWLRNAAADVVATAISDYVGQRTQTYSQLLQGTQGSTVGVYDFVDRDLIVVPELVSNSLLISVSPRLYDTVRRVIDQLDRRPPMIMVKVLLAEVTLGDGFEWGSEFGIQDSLLFDRGVAGAASNPGFNFNGNGTANLSQSGRTNIASQSLSTFGLGRASQEFGYGGFVLAAASDSVSLLLRSLQDADRLQILSRPMIMTRDNTQALVQVGETVPRVTGVSGSTGLGGVQVTTSDEEVGLILRVLPRVGADGLIRLEIDAERSAVGVLADGIPVGFDSNGNPILSPRINRTRAQSILTAFSGQTVVFGGLIQKTRSQFSRRIPYVSNIPILGALFRFDQEIERRSEMLIIMTPIIVSGDEDLEFVKQEESSRMSYCIADVVEMNGDVGLNGGYGLWGPAIGPMIYPDMTPTIDDIHMLHGNEMLLDSSQTFEGTIIDGSSPAGIPQPTPSEPSYRIPAGEYEGFDPSVVEPAYPVTPTSGVRQVQHATPQFGVPSQQQTRRPQRIPSVR